MTPTLGSERVGLSTELGFAIVGGVELVVRAPGRVSRGIGERIATAVGAATTLSRHGVNLVRHRTS